MYRAYRDQLLKSRAAQKSKKEKLIARLKARQEFFEGISISGLIEFYYAPSLLIRWMWIFALITSTGSIIYHIVLLITLYQNQEPTYDFLQTDKEIIPFPKVTICAPTGVNRTWLYPLVTLPPREQKLLANFTDKQKEEFMETAASLVGPSFQFIVDKQFKPISPHYFAYSHVVTQTFINMGGGKKGFIFGNALPTCDDTVSSCQLGGITFDCCNNSVRLIADEGSCYDLQVDKMDELLNRQRSNMTPISFSFNVKMNWNHMFEYATVNGFSVHISDPFNIFGRPIAIPAATHAFVDISQPLLRKDKFDCIKDQKMPDTGFGPYDANGHNCKMQRYFEEVFTPLIGCTFTYGSYVPDDAQLCTGSHATPLKLFLAYGDPGNDFGNAESVHQKTMFDIVHSKTRCLPLCTAWEYTPRASFSDLMRQDYTTPIGRNNTDNVAMSRVTVFIGSTFYMERTEGKLKTPYNTFLQTTEVLGLYLGCSVITVAEMMFYGCHLCLVYHKTRDKRNKVGPKV